MKVQPLLIGILVGVTALVSGCSSRIDSVSAEMEAIHNQPPQPVPPPPAFLPVPTFSYSAQRLRSPFMPPSLAQELMVMSGRKVMPDLSRPPQYLEQFPLESLRMRGTINRAGQPLFGLVEDSEGSVLRVQVGNYLGKNYGRIVGITPSQINIIEIVPDGKDGFIERPRSLVMVDVGG